MAKKISKINRKRLPKGLRTNLRRLKQAARKEIGTNNPQPSIIQPARLQKQDKA